MVEGQKKARRANGCLTALFAASAVLFLVLMFAVADLFVIEPWRSMARMRRAIPQAIETFERSRAQLDALACGEFAQGDFWFMIDFRSLHEGRRAIMPRSMERLEELAIEERDAILFLMTGEELGERGFSRVSRRDGVVRAQLYSHPLGGGMNHDGMEITWGGGPTETAALVRTHVVDLGEGYALWLYVRRVFADLGPGMLVVFAGISGIATLLLSLPLILRRSKRGHEAR